MDKILDAFDVLFQESFQYRQVDVLPDEAQRWHEEAKHILLISRTANDLLPEAEAVILQYLNGNWQLQDISRWCIPGCPCGRTEIGAKSRCKAAMFSFINYYEFIMLLLCYYCLVFLWFGVAFWEIVTTSNKIKQQRPHKLEIV